MTKIWKFFSSLKLAIWLLAIITVLSLVGTLIPQNQDVYSSFYFLLFLILLSINLTVCLVNRAPFKIRMLGSVLSHASILIILAGALIGVFFGQKGLIKICEGEEVNSFTSKGNRHVDMGFSVKLDKFIYSEHIDPKEKLLIYRSGAGGEEAPVAEIPTETGAWSDIADTGYKVKILRYLPDFAMDIASKVAVSRSAVPNNPAIEVRFKDKLERESTFWVFARFPDMHHKMDPSFKFVYHWVGRRPKDFISKVTLSKSGKVVMTKDIRVNEPLRFDGYTFFQSSYDTEALNWSGLQVVKDPGVGVVYAGFVMLISGLVIIFYVNPLVQRR